MLHGSTENFQTNRLVPLSTVCSTLTAADPTISKWYHHPTQTQLLKAETNSTSNSDWAISPVNKMLEKSIIRTLALYCNDVIVSRV